MFVLRSSHDDFFETQLPAPLSDLPTILAHEDGFGSLRNEHLCDGVLVDFVQVEDGDEVRGVFGVVEGFTGLDQEVHRGFEQGELTLFRHQGPHREHLVVCIAGVDVCLTPCAEGQVGDTECGISPAGDSAGQGLTQIRNHLLLTFLFITLGDFGIQLALPKGKGGVRGLVGHHNAGVVLDVPVSIAGADIHGQGEIKLLVARGVPELQLLTVIGLAVGHLEGIQEVLVLDDNGGKECHGFAVGKVGVFVVLVEPRLGNRIEGRNFDSSHSLHNVILLTVLFSKLLHINYNILCK